MIETHAGRGTYDLPHEAGRQQEWRAGIGRIDGSAFSPEARALIGPYLELVGAATVGAAPYPGSPVLALWLARPMDRLLFCELHPIALTALQSCIGRDRRAKAIAIDGYTGLKAYIPPVERRGLVLIDPPFEAPDEYERLTDALVAAHAKWREGILMAWYPIKDRRTVHELATKVTRAVPDVLRLELDVGVPSPEGRLVSNGLIVVNPPYTLEGEMACLLPELRRQLGGEQGACRIHRHQT